MSEPALQTNHIRVHERLMEYWQTLPLDGGLPFEADIDTEALADVWDHCFLVRVGENGFFYQYLGNALTGAYGDDLTGREICESLIYPHPEPLFRAFQQVVASGQPVHDDNAFTNTKGQVVKYRSCVLPLAAKNARGVAYIIGAMNWKAY